MDVAIYNAKKYDRDFLERANRAHGHALRFIQEPLNELTAPMALGAEAVSARPPSQVNAGAIAGLAKVGVRVLALRSTGYDWVDLRTALNEGVTVLRARACMAPAVAEHTLALILALSRNIPRAHARVRDGNFALDGLLGFDLAGHTVGIIGTGEIGCLVARLLKGFGCRILAHSRSRNPQCEALGVEYVDLRVLYSEADVITLHCPLTQETQHLINSAAISAMRPGVMLINTGRGGLIDTGAAIEGLKSGKIGYLGLDVYEKEHDLFFEDRSDTIIQDDQFERLLMFPNVIVTAHQAWFTAAGVQGIAEITLANITDFAQGRANANEVRLPLSSTPEEAKNENPAAHPDAEPEHTHRRASRPRFRETTSRGFPGSPVINFSQPALLDI